MRKGMIPLGMLVLAGCSTVSRDTPPAWQASSQHYLLSGRQGWMPGKHLHFGHYQVEIETEGQFNLLDDVLLNIRHQSVTLSLNDTKTGEKGRFHYEQRCDGGHGSLTIDEPNQFAARVDILGKQSTFSDPYYFTLNGHHYHLGYGATNWPRVITITRDGAPFAELHLGVYDGSLSAKDHIWLRKSQTHSSAGTAALLIGYAVTYDPRYCERDNADLM